MSETTKLQTARQLRKKHEHFVFWEYGVPHIGYKWMSHPDIQDCLGTPLPDYYKARSDYDKASKP